VGGAGSFAARIARRLPGRAAQLVQGGGVRPGHAYLGGIGGADQGDRAPVGDERVGGQPAGQQRQRDGRAHNGGQDRGHPDAPAGRGEHRQPGRGQGRQPDRLGQVRPRGDGDELGVAVRGFKAGSSSSARGTRIEARTF
jgi:hypothetical protein